MKFSKYFGLNQKQAELDFVDIDVSRDTRLFLDPYSIEIKDNEFSSRSADQIKTYFSEVMDALRNNDFDHARYFLFWENAQANGAKQIGVGGKQHAVPSRLIVDGQQRLTSLYAVFRGKKVLDDDYRERLIEIAFRPRDGRFEVADAATRRDPEWIPNISDLWASGKSSYQMVKGFLSSLREKAELSEEEEEQISHNLDRLSDLQKYPFT
jgi:hypothetical protein